MNKVSKKRASGFTLIELIIMIVALSVLAVSAAPKFINLSNDANRAVIQTYAANLQKAVKDANLRWQISGSPGRIQNLQGFSDNTLDMNTLGWPIGLDKGSANDNIGRRDAGCNALWGYLLIDAPETSTNTSQTFQSYRHSGNKSCSFVYRESGDTAARTAAKLGVLYNSTNGVVTACGTLTDTPC